MDSLINAFVPIIGAIVILGGIAALAGLLKAGKKDAGSPLSYRKKDALMSAAELVFFRELEKAAGSQFRIFAKVRLWDVIDMERGLDQKERGSAKGKIQSKHVDFVACDPRDMAIRFVVELDDSSHKRSDRPARAGRLSQSSLGGGWRADSPVSREAGIRESRNWSENS